MNINITLPDDFDSSPEVKAFALMRDCVLPALELNRSAWSTKGSLGKAGWVGYKTQVCETAPEEPRAPGEPTQAVITAIVTQEATASDHGSVDTVLAAHTDNGESRSEMVFADAGYISAPALIKAQSEGYELCGSVGAPPHSGTRFGSDSFDVDIPNRRATCPAGKCSSACSRICETALGTTCYYFACSRTDCSVCSLAHQCLSKKKLGTFRTLQVGEHHMQAQTRRLLCGTPDYQRKMQRRSGIVIRHLRFVTLKTLP
ncbi:MAG: hypothetical protein O3C57_01060 [Verrucomicrobia bacterium]|nr:hypothetical protein [Verrucomicrobiota bacterium]